MIKIRQRRQTIWWEDLLLFILFFKRQSEIFFGFYQTCEGFEISKFFVYKIASTVLGISENVQGRPPTYRSELACLFSKHI